MNATQHCAPVDYLILAFYFLFVIGIGWLLKKKVSTADEFLTSGRSLPLWITSLAFVATNLGAQELIGMIASGAKYGILTVHFYWGAIPAMVFVGVFMMPFYYGSRARSVPEYLKLRFDEKTRTFNALTALLIVADCKREGTVGISEAGAHSLLSGRARPRRKVVS